MQLSRLTDHVENNPKEFLKFLYSFLKGVFNVVSDRWQKTKTKKRRENKDAAKGFQQHIRNMGSKVLPYPDVNMAYCSGAV